jgi:predicted SAM-dependent methyltransferase
MRKCLEIGPGKQHAQRWRDEQWQTLNAAPGSTYTAEWGVEPLPIPADTFDYVFISHVIEHLPWYQTVDALKEVHRITKPGGSIAVWTLDFEQIVKGYLENRHGDDWLCGGRIPKQAGHMFWVAGRIFSYQMDDNDFNWHKALFDEKHLSRCLTAAGFVRPERMDIKEARGYKHGKMNMGIKAWVQ